MAGIGTQGSHRSPKDLREQLRPFYPQIGSSQPSRAMPSSVKLSLASHKVQHEDSHTNFLMLTPHVFRTETNLRNRPPSTPSLTPSPQEYSRDNRGKVQLPKGNRAQEKHFRLLSGTGVYYFTQKLEAKATVLLNTSLPPIPPTNPPPLCYKNRT